MPTVSVILPIYNGDKYLRQAIDSIINQPFADFELILVNDGSTDSSPQIIDAYTDPRIVRLDHPQNLGLTQSLNEGIALASGKYLARMDADDITKPERLTKQVNFLESHPEIGVLGGQARYLDEALEYLLWEYQFPPQHSEIAWMMMFMNVIVHPTVMLRREILGAESPYNPEFSTSEDYDLWTRLLAHTRFANLPDELLLYRRHPATVSANAQALQLEQSYHIRQRYIRETTGLDLSRQSLELLDRKGEFMDGYTQEQFRQTASLLLELLSTFHRQGHLEMDSVGFITDDLQRHVALLGVKPVIHEVIVPRELTEEEIRTLMINSIPPTWQRIYGLLRKLNLIPNPLPDPPK